MNGQMEMDFSCGTVNSGNSEESREESRKCGPSEGREHHKPTELTVDSRTYEAVKKLVSGEEMSIEVVNDIVSSHIKNAENNEHECKRRFVLIRRQVAGRYLHAYVRTVKGTRLSVMLTGEVRGVEDACSFMVGVRRDFR